MSIEELKFQWNTMSNKEFIKIHGGNRETWRYRLGKKERYTFNRELLKKYWKESGLPISKIARLTGLPTTSIWNLMSDFSTQKQVNKNNLQKIIDVFNSNTENGFKKERLTPIKISEIIYK